jgi:hypothetical protein
MFKGRGGLLFLLIVVALVVILFLLLRRGGQLPSLLGRREVTPAVPLDLLRFIPPGWEVQTDDQFECNFDDDPELEQLLIYRYNTTSLQKPLQPAGETETFGPFGGVIFDTQSSSLAPQPEPPGAYRPGSVVPYLLLPDFYPGKGEGYLGDTDVELRFFPATERGAPCRAEEINVFGYTYGPLPTRLSIFRWGSREAGYQGAHFAGSARVESNVLPEGGTQITQVTTYNRLLNHRSVLCEVNRYNRVEAANEPSQFAFLSDPEVRTIDFCFGAPPEPVYPEGVVVALLRGRNSGTGEPRSYLLDNARLPEELLLGDEDREVYNILTVGNPNFVVPLPSDGGWCSVEQVGMALAGPAPTVAPTVTPFGTPAGTPAAVPTREYSDRLWCGRERVRVETRILLDSVPRELGWSLISVRPDRPNGGAYWRVQEVELR